MNHELDMDRIINRDPRHNRRIRSGFPHREEPDSLRKFPKERRQPFKAGSRRQKNHSSRFVKTLPDISPIRIATMR